MSPLARLFWGSLVIKLILIAALPLTNDEAYYWVWSQHPQLSYYDHPPAVAWLFGLGQHLRFLPGGVRWPGALLAHLGLGLWLIVLRDHLNSRERFWWLALALASPLLGGSAFVITPDVPLLFFYAVATWAYLRWRKTPNQTTALTLGLAVGLGLTSKYMMVLFPLALVVPTLSTGELRRAFARGLPMMALGGLVGTFPVWAWNSTHDWASFRFQAHHGLGHAIYKPSWTLEYVGLQLALVTPWLVVLAWRGRRAMPSWFTWVAFTPFVFFGLTTARGYVEANWPIAGYPVLFALAVAGQPRAGGWVRGTAVVWALLLAGFAATVLGSPPSLRMTKLREFHQFDSIKDGVGDASPLFARSYQMASRLSFELDRPVYKVRGMLRHDFFDELPQSVPKVYPWYFVGEREDQLPDEILSRGDRVTEVTPLGSDFELRKVESK